MCLLPIDNVIAVISNFELVSVTEQIDFSVNNPKDLLISKEVVQTGARCTKKIALNKLMKHLDGSYFLL